MRKQLTTYTESANQQQINNNQTTEHVPKTAQPRKKRFKTPQSRVPREPVFTGGHSYSPGHFHAREIVRFVIVSRVFVAVKHVL